MEIATGAALVAATVGVGALVGLALGEGKGLLIGAGVGVVALGAVWLVAIVRATFSASAAVRGRVRRRRP